MLAVVRSGQTARRISSRRDHTGQALLARLHRHDRATKDADAIWRAALERFGGVLEAAVDTDRGDGFRFESPVARRSSCDTPCGESGSAVAVRQRASGRVRDARERGLKLSWLTQSAVEQALRDDANAPWIDAQRRRPRREVAEFDMAALLDEVRERFGA